MVIEATKENLADIIDNNDIVVVDFWAPWCGPCRSFTPIFEAVAETHKDTAAFVKINTEEEQEVAAHFQIRSIPTLMVFREQIVVFAQPGVLPEGALAKLLEEIKGLDMDEVRRGIARQQQAEVAS